MLVALATFVHGRGGSKGVLGPLLKKSLFPVERPGGNLSADWKLFFLIFYFFFLSKKSVLFSLKKKKERKKKEFAAARVAIILANRWTGNKLLLKGGLGVLILGPPNFTKTG